MVMTDTIIPLFPLGVVLFPDAPLPLHIFEERYKLMIGECMEQQKEFGIVLFSGDRVQHVGCTARIQKVLKRYADGRLDILTTGKHRFVIHEVYDTKPYLEAKVTFFDDEPEPDTGQLEPLTSKGMNLLEQLARLTGREAIDRSLTASDAKAVSLLIGGHQGFSMEEKQGFLEMRSVSERLRKGTAALDKAVKRIELTEEIRHIISGNGSVPQSLLGDLNNDH